MNSPSGSGSSCGTNEKKMDELVKLYLENMDKFERVAYEIAKENLESSYDIEKSIGFLEFVKNSNFSVSE
tara:strand:- start:341 stop:550 length:210 start_codon:yes stop_codon:yes gene_type:complete